MSGRGLKMIMARNQRKQVLVIFLGFCLFLAACAGCYRKGSRGPVSQPSQTGQVRPRQTPSQSAGSSTFSLSVSNTFESPRHNLAPKYPLVGLYLRPAPAEVPEKWGPNLLKKPVEAGESVTIDQQFPKRQYDIRVVFQLKKNTCSQEINIDTRPFKKSLLPLKVACNDRLSNVYFPFDVLVEGH